MGRVGDLGRDPRRRYPGGPAGCHVAPGPGRARETGPRHSRVRRSRDRGEVCRGRQDLCRSSCRPATACHEHHLRDDKGTRHHDPDPDVDGRQYEPCLGSGARRPKGSRRGYPVAEERRLRTFLGGTDWRRAKAARSAPPGDSECITIEDPMTVRTTSRTVTFVHPFNLSGTDEVQPAGIYTVETDEELPQESSIPAYRQIATLLRLERTTGTVLTQIVETNPVELAGALARDAQPDETAPQRAYGKAVVTRKRERGRIES